LPVRDKLLRGAQARVEQHLGLPTIEAHQGAYS
jgi:hypothetical protein